MPGDAEAMNGVPIEFSWSQVKSRHRGPAFAPPPARSRPRRASAARVGRATRGVPGFLACCLLHNDFAHVRRNALEVMNAALRSEDRSKAKPYFRFLRLLLSALRKLPCVEGVGGGPISVWLGSTHRNYGLILKIGVNSFVFNPKVS